MHYICVSRILWLLYFCISIKISCDVWLTSTMVIDEAFHLPQGIEYCYLEFLYWNPKITTLPGLYIWSMLFMAPFEACSVWTMRLSVIFANCLNVLIIYRLRQCCFDREDYTRRFVFTSCLATFPVSFLFAQFYYTDVPSMMIVNLFVLNSLYGNHIYASLLGYASFIFRQTNLVYVVFMGAHNVFGNLYKILTYPYETEGNAVVTGYTYWWKQTKRFFRGGWRKVNIGKFFYEMMAYVLPVLSALAFLYKNESITVGDKEAHPIQIHIPQYFYFSLFAAFFALPHFMCCLRAFIIFSYKNPAVPLIAIPTIAFIIYEDSIVHPYLLADNRHYLFYIWKRYFNNPFLRMLWAPVYYFCIFSMQYLLYNPKDKRFFLMFPFMVLLLVGLQGLIDLRYFMAPYVLFRCFARVRHRWMMIIEFFYNVFIIIIVLNIFYTKEIRWSDAYQVQRLIF